MARQAVSSSSSSTEQKGCQDLVLQTQVACNDMQWHAAAGMLQQPQLPLSPPAWGASMSARRWQGSNSTHDCTWGRWPGTSQAAAGPHPRWQLPSRWRPHPWAGCHEQPAGHAAQAAAPAARPAPPPGLPLTGERQRRQAVQQPAVPQPVAVAQPAALPRAAGSWSSRRHRAPWPPLPPLPLPPAAAALTGSQTPAAAGAPSRHVHPLAPPLLRRGRPPQTPRVAA